ncbi:hypothetical protein [Streptomyces albidus (ex Kaewkla and Franco 2022)]|uniref:hypothetical protein n=1 Tax=Streptomyces albidus (ex Kaewkla and Franco 2022) TaxID=722709 RepID=UPI0015EE538C|nr:hypothetical protein [Streptomyces albidus (ex Kaewkla and Franco 2022)]
MNSRIIDRPRAAVLAATIAVTAVLAVTVGCSPDDDDCDKRDQGAPTRTTSGNDAEFASLTKSSGGTSGSRGGTTSGGSKGGTIKGGTTKGGVTAGHRNNDDCDDED